MQIRSTLLHAWAILKTMSLRRICNAVRLVSSYLLSYYGAQFKLSGQPMAFAIEPTSMCNLKCPECPTGANLLKRPRGFMDIQHYGKLLKQLSPELMYLNLYVQGEPLMHPQFANMVVQASKLKLFTSTSTNGHYMTPTLAQQLVEGGLTRLIFSVDGTSQESYGLYRVGGSFHKVKQAMIDIARAKQRARSAYPIVVMQFIVFQHNEHELPYVQKLANSLKVDKLEIKTAQLNAFGKMRPPLNVKYSRYSDELGKVLKSTPNNRCWRQWHSATATWDGRFSPCCYDKDALHSFGNTNEQTVPQIWHGSKSINFKKQIFKNSAEHEMCRNCTDGQKLFN